MMGPALRLARMTWKKSFYFPEKVRMKVKFTKPFDLDVRSVEDLLGFSLSNVARLRWLVAFVLLLFDSTVEEWELRLLCCCSTSDFVAACELLRCDERLCWCDCDGSWLSTRSLVDDRGVTLCRSWLSVLLRNERCCDWRGRWWCLTNNCGSSFVEDRFTDDLLILDCFVISSVELVTDLRDSPLLDRCFIGRLIDLDLTLAYSTLSRDLERALDVVGVVGKLSPDDADDGRFEHSRTSRWAVVVFARKAALLTDFENFSSIVSRGFDDRREMERRRRSFWAASSETACQKKTPFILFIQTQKNTL